LNKYFIPDILFCNNRILLTYTVCYLVQQIWCGCGQLHSVLALTFFVVDEKLIVQVILATNQPTVYVPTWECCFFDVMSVQHWKHHWCNEIVLTLILYQSFDILLCCFILVTFKLLCLCWYFILYLHDLLASYLTFGVDRC